MGGWGRGREIRLCSKTNSTPAWWTSKELFQHVVPAPYINLTRVATHDGMSALVPGQVFFMEKKVVRL